MKRINVYELEAVLEENYQLSLIGEKAKNILIYCFDDYVPSRVIRNWANKHVDDFILCYLGYPLPFCEEDERGVLVKSDPSIYAYADDQFKDDEKRVLYFKRLNWGRAQDGNEELIKVIRDPKYINPIILNQTHDLKNRLFTVATAFTEYPGRKLVDLPSEMKELFECYLYDENDPATE